MTVTSPLGQVLRDEDGVRLENVRSYDDPMTDVWSALTDPERTARWFGRWSGDPASGSIQIVMVAEAGAPPATVRILGTAAGGLDLCGGDVVRRSERPVVAAAGRGVTGCTRGRPARRRPAPVQHAFRSPKPWAEAGGR